MNPIRPPESAEPEAAVSTPILACALHVSLWRHDIPNRLITGNDGRPLAVKIPSLLSENELAAAAAQVDMVTADDSGITAKPVATPYAAVNRQSGYSGILPVGRYSGHLFPERVTLVADLLVREAAGRAGVRATGLTLIDNGHLKQSAPRHIDSPANIYDDYPATEPGVNVHIAIANAALWELGYLDDRPTLDQVYHLAASLGPQSAGSDMARLDLRLAALYRQRCSAWATEEQSPGDAMIFPGEARLRQGRFPIVHRVISLPDPELRRAYAVMKPSYGPEDELLQQREEALTATEQPPP